MNRTGISSAVVAGITILAPFLIAGEMRAQNRTTAPAITSLPTAKPAPAVRPLVVPKTSLQKVAPARTAVSPTAIGRSQDKVVTPVAAPTRLQGARKGADLDRALGALGPTPSPTDRPQPQKGTASINPDKSVGATGANLSPASRRDLSTIGRSMASSPQSARAQQGWVEFVRGSGMETGEVGQVIQFALRESYQQSNADLAHFADKVKHFNDLKSGLRDELGRTKATLASTRDDELPQPYQPNRDALKDTEGVAVPGPIRTKSELSDYARSLDQRLNRVGNDAQLANMDLQNATLRQQQTSQTLSNVARQMHDSAMAVIGNLDD